MIEYSIAKRNKNISEGFVFILANKIYVNKSKFLICLIKLAEMLFATLRTKLAYLRPKSSTLSVEEQEKIFNINIYLFTGILTLFVGQFLFFFVTSRYPIRLLIMTILVHILLLVTLIVDPTSRKYFLPTLFLYNVLFGPVFINQCKSFIGMSIILGISV